jgi:DNA-binding beta-propeller fold protein YncE
VSIRVTNPYSLTLDAQERVIVADGQGRRVVLIDPATGNGTSLASGLVSGALVFPIHVAFDRAGGMYVADVDGYQVKKIAANGELSPFLGTGKEGKGGATGAPLAIDIPWVYAIAFDAKNDMVFIESPKGAGSVRKLETATGKITTIAEGLSEPHGLTLDSDGRYVIADTMNHRIVRVDPTSGALSVIAGSKDQKGFAGDGGPATAAKLDQPRQVSYDRAGDLYFADDATNRIRKIAKDGTITTVAGDGSATLAGDDGPALKAGMRGAWGVVVNRAGDIFIASPPAARIRKVDAKTGNIVAVGTP